MRERSRDKNRLEHMLQVIERICRYTIQQLIRVFLSSFFRKTRLFIKHHDTACRNEKGTKNGLQTYRLLQEQE